MNVDCSNFRYINNDQSQLRDYNGKDGLRKITNMYFTFILRVILHKEDIEIEWLKFGQNQLNLIQAKSLLT